MRVYEHGEVCEHGDVFKLRDVYNCHRETRSIVHVPCSVPSYHHAADTRHRSPGSWNTAHTTEGAETTVNTLSTRTETEVRVGVFDGPLDLHANWNSSRLLAATFIRTRISENTVYWPGLLVYQSIFVFSYMSQVAGLLSGLLFHTPWQLTARSSPLSFPQFPPWAPDFYPADVARDHLHFDHGHVPFTHSPTTLATQVLGASDMFVIYLGTQVLHCDYGDPQRCLPRCSGQCKHLRLEHLPSSQAWTFPCGRSGKALRRDTPAIHFTYIPLGDKSTVVPTCPSIAISVGTRQGPYSLIHFTKLV